MSVRSICRAVVAAAVLSAGATTLSAQRMLVRQPSTYLGYGYGNTSWTTFTGYFNSAFGGASNIVTTGAVGAGSLAGYSALMLTLPTLPDAPYLLTAEEQTEITTFLGTGGRLYVFGENSSWSNWNTSIAALVGGTVGGAYTGTANAAFSGGILEGVSQVYYPAGGAFTSIGGGTSLFDTNVAALFGPTKNALFILDVNLCDNSNIGTLDNRRFCQNVTGFLAGSVDPLPPSTVPEPTTVGLMGFGLLAVGAVLRRRGVA